MPGKTDLDISDPLLFGHNNDPYLVAVENCAESGGHGEVALFHRRGASTEEDRESFKPFVLVEDLALMTGFACKYSHENLEGAGRLKVQVFFKSWADCLRARDWLSKQTGESPTSAEAPYLFVNDPVQQYLMVAGRTLFLGMRFEDVRRMQVDIECLTGSGYEFCNAERETDRIIAIALGDETGWTTTLSGDTRDEKALLMEFVSLVKEKDPDVIEGHNIFNFDLPYLSERARRHGVKLALGRDGSIARTRPSRFSVGERTISYDRHDIFGRHVVDTLFLAHAYDITHRSLEGFGLKEVAAHFGVSAERRTYIEGSKITQEFKRDPAKVMAYAQDDIKETRAISALLSQSYFTQTQMLPCSYQNVCVRGNATKIDALLLREYLRRSHAVPCPDRSREFEGGYTDIFFEGVARNVRHCDVTSLYPSLMLTQRIGPKSDEIGVFLKMLESLKTFRLTVKKRLTESRSEADRNYFQALQTAFKVLINSFYGYLGFSQARFSDFDAAEKIASEGRRLLQSMITWLREHDSKPIELDTDGIYFVPPPFRSDDEEERFKTAFEKSLPKGIEIEFDDRYEAMFSYKMKNYALLTRDGEMIIRGAALKSRGLEPFQREFLRELIKLRLTGSEKEIPALKNRFEEAIVNRRWPIHMLAKTETLQESPAVYQAKVAGKNRPRDAAYELAIRSGREYRAGDQLSYYVTGDRKTAAVHENARLVTEWDPDKRDENTAYYKAKLEALSRKFSGAQKNSGEND